MGRGWGGVGVGSGEWGVGGCGVGWEWGVGGSGVGCGQVGGWQQIRSKPALGQVPGKKNQVPKINPLGTGQKKTGTYFGSAEVPGKKNQELLTGG